MGVSDRVPTSTSSTSSGNLGLASVAGAFAQAFDARWNDVTTANSLQLAAIQECCENVWQDRAPNPNTANTTPATFNATCDALIAIVNAASAYFVSIGVTPPSGTPGSAVSYVNAAPLIFTGTVNTAQLAIDALKVRDVTGVVAVAMPALDVDWSTGTLFSKTLLTGANAITFSNTTSGQQISVAITGVGGTTVTVPAGVQFPGGIVPTQTAPGTDIWTFMDVGGTIYGNVTQAMA